MSTSESTGYDSLELVGQALIFCGPGESSMLEEMHKQQTNILDTIDGATAAARIDWKIGECLWSLGDQTVDMQALVARGLNMIRTRAAASTELPGSGSLEDITITFGRHYHILHICDDEPDQFIYLVVEREFGNIALARYQLTIACREEVPTTR